MKKYLNTYHVTCIAAACAVLLCSYLLCLMSIDSIVIDYDIISATSAVSDNPNALTDEIGRLEQNLSSNEDLLEMLRIRKPFYSNLFKDLGRDNRCELTEMEVTESPKNNKTLYRVIYSGSINHLLSLLHELETKYYISVQKAGMNSTSVDGKVLRLVILIQVSSNE